MEDFPLVAGPKVTKLTTSYDPAHDNVICVESIDSIPKPPNHLTVFDLEENYTTVSYDYVGNNKISGLKVIEGEEKHVYNVGDYVVRTIDKYDFDAILNDIDVLKKSKLNRYQGRCKSGEILMVDGDGMVKTAQPEGIASSWGKITGNISSQTDLAEKLDEKVDIKQGATKSGQIMKVNSYGDVATGYVNWGEIGGSINAQSDLVSQLTSLDTKISLKLDNTYTPSDKDKFLKVGTDGKVILDYATSDYTTLSNKPKINSVELVGDKTLTQIGAVAIAQGVAHAGKVLAVSASGDVTPTNAVTEWGTITGTLDDQIDLKNKFGTKIDQNQGTSAAGKVMKVGSDGYVRPEVDTVSVWGGITGTISNQTDLMTELGDKVNRNQGTGQSGKILKVDTDGYVKPMNVLSSVDWGDIGGTLTNQTDLVNALAERIAINQTITHMGKILKVDTDGYVRPLTLKWGEIAGNLSDQTDISTALNGKVDKAYSTSDVGKALVVSSTGNVEPQAVSYNNISDKPKINSYELTSTTTLDNIGAIAKQQSTSDANKALIVSASGGVVPQDVDYTNVINKPKINSYELTTTTTLENIGALQRSYATTEAGKFMKVGTDGVVVPSTLANSVSWSDITGGSLTDNAALTTALNSKVDLASASAVFKMGVDAAGNMYFEY